VIVADHAGGDEATVAHGQQGSGARGVPDVGDDHPAVSEGSIERAVGA
jgi:hypothetical protein